MAKNTSLGNAKTNKNDEFYTRLEDIEKELSHYRDHFKGKTILCNCDDPRISNFFRYFALKFNELGLKRLITTCYKNQEADLFSQNDCEKAVWLDYYGNPNDPTCTDFSTVEIKELKGDGDFRSEECIELLKQADIVVTNPPFSLFREYVDILMKYEKKFLILGPMTATHYKEIFPLIQQNKIWLGFRTGSIQFSFPDNGAELKSFGNIRWFTNLDVKKRHEDIILFKNYNIKEYPQYFNYDAIDINKVCDIPQDYYGFMGVPDSFLEQYNPEQFEIIGIGSGALAASIGVKKNHRGRTDIAYYDENGIPKCPYSRIIIKRKK